MLKNIMATRNDVVLGILRLVLGVVFFAHGAQKVLGWFGGYGFSGSMGFYTQTLGLPAIAGFLSIVAEFLGGLGLIVGALGRVAALGIIIDMAAAVLIVHLPFGLFMNWGGTAKGEGYEFHLIAIAAALVVLVSGSGAFSVDQAVASS